MICAYKFYYPYPEKDKKAGLYPLLHIDIIELKNENLKPCHFEQIFRYKKAIWDIAKNKKMDIKINAILIGTGMDNCQNIYENCPFEITIYNYYFDINGFVFKRINGHSNETKDYSLLYKDLKIKR